MVIGALIIGAHGVDPVGVKRAEYSMSSGNFGSLSTEMLYAEVGPFFFPFAFSFVSLSFWFFAVSI